MAKPLVMLEEHTQDSVQKVGLESAFYLSDTLSVGLQAGWATGFTNSVADIISKPILNILDGDNLITPRQVKEKYGIETKEYNSNLYWGRMNQRRENIKRLDELTALHFKGGASKTAYAIGMGAGFLGDPAMLSLMFGVNSLALNGARGGIRAKFLKDITRARKLADRTFIGTKNHSKLTAMAQKFADKNFFVANVLAESFVELGIEYAIEYSKVNLGLQKQVNHKRVIGFGVIGGVLGGTASLLQRKSLNTFRDISEKNLKRLEEVLRHSGKRIVLRDTDVVSMDDVIFNAGSLDNFGVEGLPKKESQKLLGGRTPVLHKSRVADIDVLIKEIGAEDADLGVIKSIEGRGLKEGELIDYQDAEKMYVKNFLENKDSVKGGVDKEVRFKGGTVPEILTGSKRLNSVFNSKIGVDSYGGDLDYHAFYLDFIKKYRDGISEIKFNDKFGDIYKKYGDSPELFDVIPEEDFLRMFGDDIADIGKGISPELKKIRIQERLKASKRADDILDSYKKNLADSAKLVG